MINRPEYIVCCLTGMANDKNTWCGKHQAEVSWCFVDAGHAALNGKQEGRLLLCSQCRDKIAEALDAGFGDSQ